MPVGLQEDDEVEFPVVVITDGHSSRTGVKVDSVTSATELRQWLNMADTSGWTQMWDQLFAGFHQEYSRILNVLQDSERATGRVLPLNSDTVLQILALTYGQWGAL